MIHFAVEATVAVTSQAPQLALVNPSASGVIVSVTTARAFGEQGQTIVARRYGAEVEVILTGTAPSVYSFDDAAASCAAVVATKDSHTITQPNANDRDFALTIVDDTSDHHVPAHGAIVLLPGTALLLETVNAFDGTGPLMTFQIEFSEEAVQPIAYATAEVLPASGAWSTFGWFDLPPRWGSITARVSYSAHASATAGRPKVRAVWSDGTNEWVQPIVSTSLDTSTAPIALRTTHHLVEPFPAIVAGGATEAHAFAYAVFPGATRVRFDVAEVNPAEPNEGTVSVTITGE